MIRTTDSMFLNTAIELAQIHGLKINIEVRPSCKTNYIKFYKKFKNTDGSTRSKSKRIELSETEFKEYTSADLVREALKFINLD